MLFTIDSLLHGQDLARAMELARRGKYIDGGSTANYQRTIKNNQEMEVGETYLELVTILNNAIDSSEAVLSSIFPRYRTNPIINRFREGMYYKEHIDAPIQGAHTQVGRATGRFGQNFLRTDYSMTLFLCEPDTYDGGELELRLFEDVRRVKLKAGSAICYTTGIPHQVRSVIRGDRLAAIYWFQSQIRDVNMRRALRDQHALSQRLTESGQHERATEARTVLENLIRCVAEV